MLKWRKVVGDKILNTTYLYALCTLLKYKV